MHIDKQCCSIKYAERLKELGVLQDSLFYHTHSDFGILPKTSIDFTGNPTSAFNCSELMQMNEAYFGISFCDKDKRFYSGCAIDNNVVEYGSFADALAHKLIMTIEREWETVDCINIRLIS